ncbi:MAG TPA: allophycocyanin [Cyanothece sp. UBA12306]|nr:allophycocyanin [Cyanothece sp. UBA12306]
MLKQLGRLNLDLDDRYATDQELQFLEDYLNSAEKRISAYEKVRNQEESIIEDWESQKRAMQEDLFHMAGRDITEICQRDMTDILRCSAAAMLVGDLDKLRDGLLIWYRTIVTSFGYTQYAKRNYKIIQDVIKLYLSEEETAVMLPALQLDHTIVSS